MRTPSCVLLLSVALASVLTPALFGAEGVARVLDGQIKALDSDVLRLAEAMPADKYDFAPKAGSFQGVRTFAEQTRHLATVIYMMSGAVLGENPPVDTGKDDSGPAAVKTKAQLVEYLRGSLAFAHKAVGTVTEKNELDDITSPFGDGKMKRLAAASMIAWHSFDHYGQMVVYARMNGVIPPSSLPAPASAKK
jgi:DinB superfamily